MPKVLLLQLWSIIFLVHPIEGLWLRASRSNTSKDHAAISHSAINNYTDSNSNEPFTIIFLSDLESRFRGHDIHRSRYVVNYIKDLASQELTFDGDYSDYKVDPQLVLHGGDLGHFWSCYGTSQWEWYLRGPLFDGNAHNFNNWQCRTPKDEIDDLWGVLYEANIPFISNFGNHDWYPAEGTGNAWTPPQGRRDALSDRINQQSNDFCRETYQRSLQMGLFEEVEEIPPTGTFGQSMFRSVFRGVQLVSFNAAFNWQSYGDNDNDNDNDQPDATIYNSTDQLDRLDETLLHPDNNKYDTTFFFSHFPLSKRRLRYQEPSVDHALKLMAKYAHAQTDMVHHFAGHYHDERVEDYTVEINVALPTNQLEVSNDTNTSSTDGSSETTTTKTVIVRDHVAAYPHHWGILSEPGFLAILVSPVDGILQVKSINIPGLENGTRCTPVQYRATSIIHEGCDACKAGMHTWSFVKGWFVCGD